MISAAQLQQYLRHIAKQQYDSIKIKSFTLYFHPTDAFQFFNYAIPDEVDFDNIEEAITGLRSVFSQKKRQARFEFIHEYIPQLAKVLPHQSFVEEARQCLMVCNAKSFTDTSNMPRLRIEEISQQSEVTIAQKFMATQRAGFGGDPDEMIKANEAKHFLHSLGNGKAFLGWLDDVSVAAGMFSAPHQGITELAGLATLKEYRKQGIATAMTAYVVKRAFEEGAKVVFLTAADEQAGRMYQRAGFQNHLTMLAYIDRIKKNI